MTTDPATTPWATVTELERPCGESRPTREELLKRAREISDGLIARQEETEDRTFYAEDTHEAFKNAGFYRMLVPQRYGGYEVDIGTFFRVIVEISRGCPSTGWALCLAASHAVTVATYFPEEAQDAIFRDDLDGHFLCASVAKPSVKIRRAEKGGWTLDGEVSYASGIPYSNHFLGYAIVPGTDPSQGKVMSYIAPRGTWLQLDDWGDSLGLRGSGSHSIRFENASIPEIFAWENINAFIDPVAGGTVGSRLHNNSMYAGRSSSLYNLDAAAIVVGMLKGAIEAYREHMGTTISMLALTTKKTEAPLGSRSMDPDFQRYYGLMVAKHRIAEAAMQRLCDQWMESCRRSVHEGVPFDDVEDLSICVATNEINKLCWDAMQSLILPTVGPRQFVKGRRIERIFRDMAMKVSHPGSQFLEGPVPRRAAVKMLGSA